MTSLNNPKLTHGAFKQYARVTKDGARMGEREGGLETLVSYTLSTAELQRGYLKINPTAANVIQLDFVQATDILQIFDKRDNKNGSWFEFEVCVNDVARYVVINPGVGMTVYGPKTIARGSYATLRFIRTSASAVELVVKAYGSAVSGSMSDGPMVSGVYPLEAQEDVTGGGAIADDVYYTAITTGAVNEAYTTGQGEVVGQLKKISLETDGGGDAVVTFANGANIVTATLDDAGDFVLLIWRGDGWFLLENFGCAITV